MKFGGTNDPAKKNDYIVVRFPEEVLQGLPLQVQNQILQGNKVGLAKVDDPSVKRNARNLRMHGVNIAAATRTQAEQRDFGVPPPYENFGVPYFAPVLFLGRTDLGVELFDTNYDIAGTEYLGLRLVFREVPIEKK